MIKETKDLIKKESDLMESCVRRGLCTGACGIDHMLGFLKGLYSVEFINQVELNDELCEFCRRVI